MENLQQLFEHTIRDLYNAEMQFRRAAPSLMKAARDSQLKATVETYITQCEDHVNRLDRVAELGNFDPTGRFCQSAMSQIEETSSLLQNCVSGSTMDATIIAGLQKSAHYQICSYGTVLAWAEVLENKKASGLLRQSLVEARQSDELLSAISEEVNRSAGSLLLPGRVSAVKEMVESLN